MLVHYAALAERYVFDDPKTALIKLGQFGELLAQRAAASCGIAGGGSAADVLSSLWDRGVTNREVAGLFHGLRKARNEAVHNHGGTRREALHQLKMARTLAVWYQRSFGGNPDFKPGPFLPPPEPVDAENALADELAELRQRVADSHA